MLAFASCNPLRVNVGSGLSTKDYQIYFFFDEKNDTTLLVAEVESEDVQWSQEPKLMFRLGDNSLLELNGNYGDVSYTESESYMTSSNIIISDAKYHSKAYFPISDVDARRFQNGVIKMRASLVPAAKDKNWSKDVIGKHLYKAYLKLKTQSDAF